MILAVEMSILEFQLLLVASGELCGEDASLDIQLPRVPVDI
jgi:hypothetical protein